MFFHPKSENDNPWFKPWFSILLHTQSIVCAIVDSQCLEYLGYITLTNSCKKKGHFSFENSCPTLFSTQSYIWRVLLKKVIVCFCWRTPHKNTTPTFFFFTKVWEIQEISFSNFFCMFLNPNNFFQFEFQLF